MPTYSLENSYLSLKVNSFGAEMCSVKSLQDNLEYIWQADKSVWARHAPNLFPIVGKLKNGEYTYQGRTYQLPQHGFARDLEFECIEQTPAKLVFELKDTEDTRQNYPFHFSYKVCYYLDNNLVVTQYIISNTSDEELFFSVGAHPAFNCPLTDSETFEDYELVFPGKSDLKLNGLQDGLVSDSTRVLKLEQERLGITEQLFESDALVCMDAQIDEVSLVSRKTNRGVTLRSYNWPYFGIWSKPQSNRFVCLEPWYGIADLVNAKGNLSGKTGIIKLEALQNFSCEFSLNFF